MNKTFEIMAVLGVTHLFENEISEQSYLRIRVEIGPLNIINFRTEPVEY